MIEVQIGDSRHLIHGLADKSIDCVVTSPPYWGLRDYKTEPIIFDDLLDCEHEWTEDYKSGLIHENRNGLRGSSIGNNNYQRGLHGNGNAVAGACSICGAWRGQLGLEPTPELFIKHLLDFFDNVKLKLKDEGNCFVNLGDSYYGSPSNSKDSNLGNAAALEQVGRVTRQKHDILQSKSLCMIPQRFAWCMIERGWILRNEIIWAKPNHMPESVTDRLTKSHEVIYHFVKQQKYYYDLDSIREPHKTESIERYDRSVQLGANAVQGKILQREEQNLGYPRHAPKWFIEGQNPEAFGSPRARTQRNRQNGKEQEGNDMAMHWGEDAKGKNPGDVWNITTQPYPESHFATFPLELIRRPILAGCPIGGTVLDPFAGSGTVGEFCRNNDRNAILFELNPDYKKLIEDRAMLKVPELSEWCSSQEDA